MAILPYDEVNPSRIFPDTKYMKSFTVVLVNDLIAKINAQGAADFAAVWAAINDLDATKVDGPGSSVDDNFMLFSGATGKVAKDSGIKVSSTTEVLTGTAADRLVTPDALAALWEAGASVAAATSMSLGEGGYFTVTGTGVSISQITFTTAKNGRRALLRFNAANTIVHNGTTGIICPGGANLAVGAGDAIELICHGSGTPLYIASLWLRAAAGLPAVALASTADMLAGTETTKALTADAAAALWEKNGSAVASASSISLGEGGYFEISGTTGITAIAFGTPKDGRRALLYFQGALTITHSATLVCPGAVNLIVAAGDIVEVLQHSSTVRAVSRVNAKPVVRVVQQIFEVDGTYTPTPGMLYCIAELVGGGGGSGGVAAAGASNQNGATGGGGGEYVRSLLTAAQIGASKAVDIGAGGGGGATGANDGSAGSDTTLGTTLVVAKGGLGGLGATTNRTVGGVGGSGGTGDFKVAGGTAPGSWGVPTTLAGPSNGAGGSSALGAGAANVYGSGNGFSPAATSYGGGASGAMDRNSGTGTARAGAAGANGVAIITEFIAP